ncbi:serine/threonine protein kinase [Candidatus Obscuribacterales bacterium]|nr:serine/threonine protein kinase [Candidatus Obscuribacterales bacterium]MBX3153677.1 serine/threonine protein kinase [Candidatus Obscuribacterales bacterium]
MNSASGRKKNEFPYVLRDRWEVVHRLGQGGMGTVYMARDLNLSTLSEKKKAAVVKELRDDFIRGEDKEKAKEFFMREVHVLADLDHPNIVRVLDQFSVRDQLTGEEKYYLVMEYVQGQNLHEMITKRQEPFDEELVIDWAVQVCDVLTYLHTHNPPVIYRDLKPSNIMINTHDQVKLVDFGIARPFEDSEDNTHVVSQGYSPPEQYWGAADPRSDVYALGATIHFLLTGQDPLALTVSSPQSINPEVSDHINEIVKRATHQDAEGRYQCAADMKDALRYRPVIEQPEKAKTLYVVLASIAVIGFFLGGLVILGKLQDQQETSTKEVRTLEEQRLEAKAKELSEQEEKLKNFKRLLRQEMENAQKTGPSTALTPPTPGAAWELTEESILTDPEGLK